MIEQAHLDRIEWRIQDLKHQLEYTFDGRLRRSIAGLIQNEESRLSQWTRLIEIRASDGE